MVMNACNPSTPGGKAGGCEFQASLGYIAKKKKSGKIKHSGHH
jgi:hypothetical protein